MLQNPNIRTIHPLGQCWNVFSIYSKTFFWVVSRFKKTIFNYGVQKKFLGKYVLKKNNRERYSLNILYINTRILIDTFASIQNCPVFLNLLISLKFLPININDLHSCLFDTSLLHTSALQKRKSFSSVTVHTHWFVVETRYKACVLRIMPWQNT